MLTGKRRCSTARNSESRRPARTTAAGDLLRLADQDRTRWNRDLIVEGQAIVRACLRRNQPGPYQIQAAINAVHSDAAIRMHAASAVVHSAMRR